MFVFTFVFVCACLCLFFSLFCFGWLVGFLGWVGLEGFLFNYLCFYCTLVMPTTQTDQQLPISELLGDSVRVLWVSLRWIPAGSVPTSSTPAPSHPELPLTPPVHSSSWWTHSSCSIPHPVPPKHPQNLCTGNMGVFCIGGDKNQPPNSSNTLAVQFTCSLCALERLLHAQQISHQSSQMPSPAATRFLQH